jgi:two-component system, LuxR family, sensor kinase FixL
MFHGRNESEPGIAQYLRDAAVFLGCYLLLDWASFIEPLGAFNITPWNPVPALAIAWMTLRGFAQWPLVLLTLVLGDVLVRDAPAGYAVTAGSNFVLAAGYAGIALVLSSALRGPALRGSRDLALFTATIVIGASIVGGAYVNVLAIAGLLPGISTTEAWLRFWLGDAVGILVTGPLIFALVVAQDRARLAAVLRDTRSWMEWAVLCLLLWLVFRAVPQEVTARFYVLFVPILWIAMRSGLSGAVLAMVIVQVGVILGEHGAARHLSIVEVQVLVCILCVTGLFLGAVVDERRQAAAELREALRRSLAANERSLKDSQSAGLDAAA